MAKITSTPAPFYAIRHIPSGFLIPAGGKGRRGHTHQEPSATQPPRLFKDFHRANRALECYVQGKWIETTIYSYEGEPDASGPEPKRSTARIPKDFDLIEVWLNVKEIGKEA